MPKEAYPDLFPDLMPRKVCSECDTRKPICLYWDNASTADGKDQICMKCRQKLNRENNLAYKPRSAAPSMRRQKVSVG